MKLSIALAVFLALSTASSADEKLDVIPRPAPVELPSAEEIEAGICRGVDFLLKRQEKNGAWGSARRTKGLNVLATVPGAHHAFRGGVTSLCISALIESGDKRSEVQKAIDRGEQWMFDTLERVRRAAGIDLYNVWTHSYAISALVRLHERADGDEKRQQRIAELIRHQIGMLERYETVNGGWGYYNFGYATRKPSGQPTSFTTATALIALHEAKRFGIEVPEKMVNKAIDTVRKHRNNNFTYDYSIRGFKRPVRSINRPGGSLGRSQVCNLALRLWGDEKVTDQVLIDWLDRLFARNMWLDIGRKRPIPHESWFLVAGYFYYYGHYYAAGCIEQLPEKDRPRYKAHMARLMLRLQEKTGCWWDFPLYDYHEQYGTALAVMTLVGCRGG